jgi:GT2 family glycosyltransferase
MLTVVIVSYNSATILERCMDELLLSGAFQIIIVDNNSPDGSADVLRNRYPKTTVVSLNQNIGYGRAANIGIHQADTPYIFLLNPDLCVGLTEITAFMNWIEREKPDAALYAPAVKTRDFLKQGAVAREWVIGAAMLFDMERMKHIGFFDENIFLFYEEKDLCYRIRAAHEKILLCSDFYFKHLKGKGSPHDERIETIKNWHVGWSSIYFLKKHTLDTGKHCIPLLISKYLVKSVFSWSPLKRKKFRVRLTGMKACLQGENAFLPDGTPQPLHNEILK